METFADLLKAHENPWGTVIAPYLAERIYAASKDAYADVRLVPKDVEVYETNIVTLLLRQADGEHVRVYLWVGKRDEAKKANCLMDLDEPVGRFVFVKTTIPHDIELYTKYEILEECEPSGMFCDERISAILASSPPDVKKASDDVFAAIIQKGVEAFAIETMSSDAEIVAIYMTNRKLRRGLATLFEEKDILVGTTEIIRALGEQEDSEGTEDSSDSDYDVATSDHAEAAEFLIRQLESGSEGSEGSEESDGSEDSSEDSTSYNTTDAKVDDLVDFHNEIVQIVTTKGGLAKNRAAIDEILGRMIGLGIIEYDDASESESDDDEDPPFDLMDMNLEDADESSESERPVRGAGAGAGAGAARAAPTAAPTGPKKGPAKKKAAADEDDGLVALD